MKKLFSAEKYTKNGQNNDFSILDKKLDFNIPERPRIWYHLGASLVF
jgi:hypothetical protein